MTDNIKLPRSCVIKPSKGLRIVPNYHPFKIITNIYAIIQMELVTLNKSIYWCENSSSTREKCTEFNKLSIFLEFNQVRENQVLSIKS